MSERGVYFKPADNKRVAGSGALGGWDQLRSRLKGDGEVPALFLFDTCRDLIRTLPTLQHDPDRPEAYVTPAPETEEQIRDRYYRRRRQALGRRGSQWVA